MIHTIKRTIHWCGPYKKRLYIGFVVSFINAIFISLPIIATGHAITLVLQQMQGTRQMMTSDVYQLIILMLVAIIGRYVCSYYRAVLQESIGYEVAVQQRIRIGNTMKRVPLSFFQKKDSGSISAAVTTDLSFIEMHALKMLDTIINGYIGVVAFLIILSFYNIWITIVAGTGLLVSAFFLKQIGVKARENAIVHQQSKEEMIAATIEYIRGIAIVKSFKLEGAAKQSIEQAFKKAKDINIKIEKDFVVPNTLHLITLKCTSVFIVGIAAIFALLGKMDLATMVMLIVFSFVIFRSVEPMNDAMHVLKVIDETFDKLDSLDNAKYFIDEKGKDMMLHAYDIQFNNVSFGYDQRKVLNDISFTIAPNTTTAIVGPSGSGKSTICHLIARFYDVNDGVISIGGIPITDFTCDSLLQHISIVFQKVYLFQDTIMNNIRFGKPDATDEEVYEAAKKACCHSFIMDLPDSYNTVIGDGGATLSGGEKQRISIARSIIKDAPIVILDEATASIDPENEHLIQEAIGQLVAGKTLIVIAHRLKTIEQADQIVVLQEGEVVQTGIHQQLMNEEGLYRHLILAREKTEHWEIGEKGAFVQ